MGHVRRDERSRQPYLNLFVWHIKGIVVVVAVVILYRYIAALVEQRHYRHHGFRWRIKLACVLFNACYYICRQHIELVHHIYQICGSAGTEPIVTELFF